MRNLIMLKSLGTLFLNHYCANARLTFITNLNTPFPKSTTRTLAIANPKFLAKQRIIYLALHYQITFESTSCQCRRT